MNRHLWAAIAIAPFMIAAFASCKKDAASGTGGMPAASSSHGTGGGVGGAGGGSGGSGGAMPEAGPIMCTATYTNVVGGSCDLLKQDCPAGQSCAPVPSGAGVTTTCTGASGVKTAGEPCYTSEECDAKLICVGTPGKCVAFCCNDMAAEPCNGGLCITKTTLNQAGTYYAYTCSYGKRCTLLTPDACPSGQNCYVEDVAQGLATCDEQSPDPKHELDACQYLNDCDSMQGCALVPGLASRVCLYYCDLSGPNTGAAPGLGGCPTGETCHGSYEGKPIDVGVSGIGLCIPDSGITPKDAG